MKAPIKQRIKEYIAYKGLSQFKFEKSAGLSNGYIANISKSISTDKLLNILSAFPDINKEWLLYGNGNMLLTGKESHEPKQVVQEIVPSSSPPSSGVPLVNGFAEAGSNVDYMYFDETKVLERLEVPRYISGLKVDFAVPVNGNSMIPTYNPGDRLLVHKCDRLDIIQWGRAYLVASASNGIMVKRLLPCTDNEGYIICKSDNPDFPPFKIPYEDVKGIALVLTMFRNE